MKKADSPEVREACQCLYIFYDSEQKVEFKARGFNHVLINQIVRKFSCSFIRYILEGRKNFKKINESFGLSKFRVFEVFLVKLVKWGTKKDI